MSCGNSGNTEIIEIIETFCPELFGDGILNKEVITLVQYALDERRPVLTYFVDTYSRYYIYICYIYTDISKYQN